MMNEIPTTALRWIILLPLLGALLNGVVLRSKRAVLAGGLATAATFASFIVSIVAWAQNGSVNVVDRWFTWFEAGSVRVPFHLELTPVTCIMLLVVTGIGSLIHLYAIGYMSHEKSPWRFFAYLNLFVAAMLVLILSANLVGVFLGWEGVGLCSYLLIGYWFDKDANAAAGMKAMITNRVGDLGFLIALFAAFAGAGTANIRELLQLFGSHSTQVPALTWLILCGGLFWASTGKSAQIPLYVWLPDAMAGPTPVSALIHAATMVTSGVFVTVRLWPIFAGQPQVLEVMLVIGIATAWLAALIALTQRDIKKVLAYSTVSQLGFMFAALGAGAPTAAFFHVVTHACFKALLFLGAGSVIHGMHEKQDLYEMGDLRRHMPSTHWTFLAGTLAIIGFPLTAGFFSKDLILGMAFEHGWAPYLLLLGAALLTAFYMLRLYTLAFWGEARSEAAAHAHESSPVMTVPLMVLGALSILVGWFETPHILGGIHAFGRWVEGSAYGQFPEGHGEAMSLGGEALLILFTTGASLAVAWFSYQRYQKREALAAEGAVRGPLEFLTHLFDNIYRRLLVEPLRYLARVLTDVLDQGFINGVLHGLRDGVRVSGQVLSLFHTGNVQTYAWYLAAASAAAVLFWGWALR